MPGKILIAYYTWSGNTRKIAELIKRETDGTVFEILPEVAYSADYNTVVALAKREIQAGFKPVLKSKIDNIGIYEVILIGTPNWWSTIAPPVAAFLSGHDLAGKTIVPFFTHGGGGQGRILKDITRLCPNSTVLEGFETYRGGAGNVQAKVAEWLRKTGIVK